MKMSDTVIGGEYWFFGQYGPYRTKGIAVGSARRQRLVKCYDSFLFRAVRVSKQSELAGISSIQSWHPKQGEYLFSVLERFNLEDYGVIVD